MLSKIFLSYVYTWYHYTAAIFSIIGSANLYLVTAANQQQAMLDFSSVTSFYICLIMLQGIASSIASVWNEKLMKVDRSDDTFLVEGDTKEKVQLYWFLNDSLHMYLVGLPFYAASFFYSSQPGAILSTISTNSVFACVGSSIEGIMIGSIIVYYSSILRSFQTSLVILILILISGHWKNIEIYPSFLLVCWSLYLWYRGNALQNSGAHFSQPIYYVNTPGVVTISVAIFLFLLFTFSKLQLGDITSAGIGDRVQEHTDQQRATNGVRQNFVDSWRFPNASTEDLYIVLQILMNELRRY